MLNLFGCAWKLPWSLYCFSICIPRLKKNTGYLSQNFLSWSRDFQNTKWEFQSLRSVNSCHFFPEFKQDVLSVFRTQKARTEVKFTLQQTCIRHLINYALLLVGRGGIIAGERIHSGLQIIEKKRHTAQRSIFKTCCLREMQRSTLSCFISRFL